MLTAFSCDPGHRPIRLTDVGDVASVRKAVWIDLLDPTADEEHMVQEAIGLAVPSREEISEIENSSRLNIRDDVLYLSMPMVSMADGPRITSVGFVLSRERLITVRFAAITAFNNFTTKLTKEPPHTGSGAHALLGILEALVDRQADVLETAQVDLDDISHRVFALG